MIELDQPIIIVKQWPREILYQKAIIAKKQLNRETLEKRSEEILKKSKAIVDEWAEENLLLKRALTFEEFVDILPDVRKLNTKQLILGSAANLLVFSLVNFVMPISLMALTFSSLQDGFRLIACFLFFAQLLTAVIYTSEYLSALESWESANNILNKLWIKYFCKPLHYFNFLRKKKIEQAIHILVENKKIDKIFS